MSTPSIKELLTKAIKAGASDMHIVVGAPPMIRLHGGLEAMPGYPRLTAEQTQEVIYTVMNEDQIAEFESTRECDLSFGIEGLSRFRLNVYRDRGSVVAAFRSIPFEILSFEQLGLPRVIADFAYKPFGLVLVCGPTGSGKSTTLASIIDKINRERNTHIITIEDPIEYLHRHNRSVVNQREINADTNSFGAALKRVLRQDPDVILIGEMRDAETVRTALASAETGHLVFSTLHTVDAVETLNRVIDFFEPHQQLQIRKQLASVLRGVVSQRILPLATGHGRCVAAEVLLGTRTVRDFIEKGKSFKDIVQLIEEGNDQYGMQTFDQALYDLWKEQKITAEVALLNATSQKDLKLRMQGMSVK